MGITYSFGAVEVRPDQRKVLVDGMPADLGARAFDVLIALIERRDRVVTKNELLDIVWPGLVVEENNLQVQVSSLRKALGAGALATIPGRGYRFALQLDGQPREEPPAASLIPRTNVVAAWEPMIGRDAETAELAGILSCERVVTIVGTGGIGKTRLAKEVARAALPHYRDGVWWVDLSAISSAGGMAPAIAKAASLALGTGDPEQRLIQLVRARNMLLVLDNCEHLVEGVSHLVARILDAAQDVRILVTSQVLLNLRHEKVYPLAPLSLPARGCSPEAVRASPAFQLLARRAGAANARFSLEEAGLDAPAELCRRLDGIPLAIEMAAARLPLMGVRPLTAALGERLRLLRNADLDAFQRHRTLRATLDWSHSLLADVEKVVLRRLAVFAGEFRIDRAQRVASLGTMDEWEALEALFSLAEKSLLQVEPKEPPLYRLLETTRLYAMEQLWSSGELEEANRSHGHAMAELGREIGEAFVKGGDIEWLARYAPFYEDLVAAFERACTRKDAEIAGETVDGLARIDWARGDFTAFLARKRMIQPLLASSTGRSAALLWSFMAVTRTPFPGISKVEACEAAVEAWKSVGDRQRQYRALSVLAMAHGTAGNYVDAKSLLEEAHRMEDPTWPPQVRMALALCEATARAYGDDMDALAASYEEAARLAYAAGSRRVAGMVQVLRVEVMLNRGELAGALALSRAVVDDLRSSSMTLAYANALSTQCAIALALGDAGLAREAAAEALPHSFSNHVAGWLLDQVSVYAARKGDLDRAARLLGAADAAYAAIEEVRRLQDRRGVAEATCLIDAGIAGEHARLRAEGAALPEARVMALAAQALAG